MQELLLELAKVSPFLALAALYIWRMHRDLRAVETKRVDDLKAILDSVLKQSIDSSKVADKQARAVERTNQMVQELTAEIREALRELGDADGDKQ